MWYDHDSVQTEINGLPSRGIAIFRDAPCKANYFVRELQDALEAHPYGVCHFENIDVSNVEWPSEDISSLFELLRDNGASTQRFKSFKGGLRDDAIRKLCEWLFCVDAKAMPQEIHLSHNELTSKAFNVLVSIIELKLLASRPRSPLWMRIEGNRIRVQDVQVMVSAGLCCLAHGSCKTSFCEFGHQGADQVLFHMRYGMRQREPPVQSPRLHNIETAEESETAKQLELMSEVNKKPRVVEPRNFDIAPCVSSTILSQLAPQNAPSTDLPHLNTCCGLQEEAQPDKNGREPPPTDVELLGARQQDGHQGNNMRNNMGNGTGNSMGNGMGNDMGNSREAAALQMQRGGFVGSGQPAANRIHQHGTSDASIPSSESKGTGHDDADADTESQLHECMPLATCAQTHLEPEAASVASDGQGIGTDGGACAKTGGKHIVQDSQARSPSRAEKHASQDMTDDERLSIEAKSPQHLEHNLGQNAEVKAGAQRAEIGSNAVPHGAKSVVRPPASPANKIYYPGTPDVWVDIENPQQFKLARPPAPLPKLISPAPSPPETPLETPPGHAPGSASGSPPAVHLLPQATRTFKHGEEVGIIVSDNGTVLELISGGQADKNGLKVGDRILKLGDAAYSVDALKNLANGCSDYTITFQVGSVTPTPGTQPAMHPPSMSSSPPPGFGPMPHNFGSPAFYVHAPCFPPPVCGFSPHLSGPPTVSYWRPRPQLYTPLQGTGTHASTKPASEPTFVGSAWAGDNHAPQASPSGDRGGQCTKPASESNFVGSAWAEDAAPQAHQSVSSGSLSACPKGEHVETPVKVDGHQSRKKNQTRRSRKRSRKGQRTRKAKRETKKARARRSMSSTNSGTYSDVNSCGRGKSKEKKPRKKSGRRKDGSSRHEEQAAKLTSLLSALPGGNRCPQEMLSTRTRSGCSAPRDGRHSSDARAASSPERRKRSRSVKLSEETSWRRSTSLSCENEGQIQVGKPTANAQGANWNNVQPVSPMAPAHDNDCVSNEAGKKSDGTTTASIPSSQTVADVQTTSAHEQGAEFQHKQVDELEAAVADMEAGRVDTSFRETALKDWLRKLDNGKGALLQYFEGLRSQFDADFVQISAAKLAEPCGPGLLDAIDPSFFEACGIQRMGHKLLFAKAIAELEG